MAVCAMVALRILQRTQRVDVAPDRTKNVHFMRFKNSYAAAVAAAVSAVVFSAAFQPAANATTIVIDSFTNNITPNPSGTSTNATGNNIVLAAPDSIGAPSGTVYDERAFSILAVQDGGSNRTAATFSGTFNTIAGGGGSLSYGYGKTALTSGTATTNIIITTGFQYNNVNFAPFDWTSSSNTALRITKSSGTFSGAATKGNPVTLTVEDSIGNTSSVVLTRAEWFSSNTVLVDYTSFAVATGDPVDFTDVTTFYIQDVYAPNSSADRAASVSAGVTLTEIALVPEPTHMVSVAGIGAAYGAWRLRKLRRSRTAAGDAIAS
jgi:hypothetical protein